MTDDATQPDAANQDDGVNRYVATVDPANRPTFDRIDALIRRTAPEAEVVISYAIPTYRLGRRRLYLAAWKHGVSLYGWGSGQDGGFVERHPETSSGQGTIKLTPKAAEDVDDDEIRALIRGALDG